MKAFDIAIKDMTRSFRSAFALVFMFGVPLLMTGMFYFMFGGTANSSQGFSIPVTKVVVANLDKGAPSFKIHHSHTSLQHAVRQFDGRHCCLGIAG